MIQSTRKRLAVIAVAAIVIVVVIVSAWGYYASPVEREGVLIKTKRVAIKGVMSGGAYALLAVGFSLVYGVTEVINFGYGALLMLGTYLFFVFGPWGWYLQLEVLPAIILAITLIGIVGIIVYRLCIHPVVGDPLAPLVSTVGVAITIQQLVLVVFETDYRPVRLFEVEPPPINIWGASVYYTRLLAFVVSLALFAGLWLFVAKTKIGGAMRAVAQDREVAMLMGVNTERIYMLTMAIGASLAALAGILIVSSADRVIHPFMWQRPLIMSFAVVIIGGLGSIKGSLLGAFIVGYTETAVINFVPAGGYLTGVAYLGIMVLVLLLRPRGIFGKRIELE